MEILYWSAIARYCVVERQQADALQEDRNELRVRLFYFNKWSVTEIPFCWGYCVVERQQADALQG